MFTTVEAAEVMGESIDPNGLGLSGTTPRNPQAGSMSFRVGLISNQQHEEYLFLADSPSAVALSSHYLSEEAQI